VKVKVGNQIFDSSDQPIAVLFTTDDEIAAANRVNSRGRAVGSFPHTMAPLEAQLFLNEGWDGLSYKVKINVQPMINKLRLPEPPRIG